MAAAGVRRLFGTADGALSMESTRRICVVCWCVLNVAFRPPAVPTSPRRTARNPHHTAAFDWSRRTRSLPPATVYPGTPIMLLARSLLTRKTARPQRFFRTRRRPVLPPFPSAGSETFCFNVAPSDNVFANPEFSTADRFRAVVSGSSAARGRSNLLLNVWQCSRRLITYAPTYPLTPRRPRRRPMRK